jgi:hypothetical protein
MTSDANASRDSLVMQPPGRHPNRPKRWLTRRAQAKRYGKSKRTIERWGREPKMGMPPETWFNDVPHREEAELDQWDTQRPRGKRPR